MLGTTELARVVCAAANTELDFDTTRKLMKERQRLQQELSLLEEDEEVRRPPADVIADKTVRTPLPSLYLFYGAATYHQYII